MHPIEDNKRNALKNVLGQIEKQFGKGSVMRLGDSPTVRVEVIPTGSLSLDIALGIGGFPRGRVVEIYGPESSGKTTCTLQVVANAKNRWNCGVCGCRTCVRPTLCKKIRESM